MKLLDRVAKLGRKRHEPERLTDEYPRLVQLLQGQQVGKKHPTFKPTPWNLRAFSHTPYARRAINAIKNPIAQLGWEVVPLDGVAESAELKRQCAVVTYCLNNPNREDSWRSLVERVVTDMMLGGGAVEQRLGGDPNRPLWLYPVDALSIQIYPLWDGTSRAPKYRQVPGYGMTGLNTQTGVDLLDSELMYLVPNPSTATPFGVGPLEVAFASVSRLLGAGEYAGNLATNARPNTILNLGGVQQADVAAFRQYWEREIEGQGKMPILGGAPDLEAVKLTADGDGALYLKWQEFLKSEIAAAFDLSPQNLGIERDVNRNCYSEDTQTLTPDGWRFLDELSEESLVAAYNPATHAIEFRKPDLLHVAEYEGDMIHISGHMTDTLVTPDHRMWARRIGKGDGSKKPGKNYEIVSASEMLTGKYAVLASFDAPAGMRRVETFTLPGCPCAGGVRKEYPSREIDMGDWLRFVGFWLAEGHAGRYGAGTWKVNICQKEGTEICREMGDLIARLPFDFSSGVSADGVRRWQVADKALCRWLLMECGIGSHAKRVPSFVFALPAEQSILLYESAMKGDGTRNKKPGRRSVTYYTACAELRDGLQLLATYAGHRAVATPEKVAGVYRVKITESTKENEVNSARNVSRVQYSGRVYCFSVPPHHLFVTRRNGKIAVHGNTAETAESRDHLHAIVPWATLVSSHINRDAIQGLLGFSQIEFRFTGLDREDEVALAGVHKVYYELNVLTPNEIREEIGKPPSEGEWGDKYAVDVEIAKAAARNVGQVLDDDLAQEKKGATPAEKPAT